jgi:hypothetical protein
MNRWWTSILTVIALCLATTQLTSLASADMVREGGRDSEFEDIGGGGGGAPPPTGAGDPDQPQPTSLKYQQRGSVRAEGAYLTSRSAGDSRFMGSVWMWRLSVMGRVVRSYWVRY